MTASDEEKPLIDESVTPQDMVDVLRGRATREQSQRVAEALDDQDSPASHWIAGLSQLAENFPGQGRPLATSKSELSPETFGQLNTLQCFVQRKHASGDMTDDEIASLTPLLKEGKQLTPVDAELAKKSLLRAVVTLHPEFGEEVRDLISARQR